MKVNRPISFVLRATLIIVGLNLFQPLVHAQKHAEETETIVSGQTAMVWVANGELLRFRAFNPLLTESGKPNESISLQLKFFDEHGKMVFESSVVAIPPGEFRWIDTNREDLNVAGDPSTGRAQIRTQALWGLSSSARINVPTSLDLVDKNTGAGTFRFYIIVETLP